MKYAIEFELPNNKTIEDELQGSYVSWSIWGYTGIAKARPVEEAELKKGKWNTVKTILDELEYENEKLLIDFFDATARLKAINKIAESSQAPRQKIDGIKPLAEMGVTE